MTGIPDSLDKNFDKLIVTIKDDRENDRENDREKVQRRTTYICIGITIGFCLARILTLRK